MKQRIPDQVADGIIGVGLFVMSLAYLQDYQQYGLTAIFSRQTDALGLLLIAGQTLPLVVRRRYPVTVLVTVVAAFMVDRGLDYPASSAGIGALVALHAVGSQLPPRRSLLVGGAAIAFVTGYTVLGSVLLPSVGLDDAAFTLLSGIAALYLGREVRQRRTVARLVQERADRMEREREEAAQAAVADERARIARELHDVVAHQIVVMTVQAEGAARLAGDADPRVRTALQTISSAGREGLAEMRRMVGLLRATGDGDPRAPQPGLADLPDLARHFMGAGLPVTLHVSGEQRRLPGGIDLSAYRIVQESLTNALKHGGPGVSADVRLAYAADRLDIRVVDDGRGMTGPGGAGHGLVGMRERADLLAGEFEAGNQPGGGFAVQARIPVPA